MYYSIFAVHLTLEQHGFELCGLTYTWMFFNKYVLWDYDLQI